jgi:hypothetical protein
MHIPTEEEIHCKQTNVVKLNECCAARRNKANYVMCKKKKYGENAKS